MTVDELKLKIQNQKISVATFQRKFNEANATIKIKESEIRNLNESIKSQNEELNSMNEIIENLSFELNDSKESNATIRKKISEATATVKSKASEIIILNNIIESKDQVIKNLQASFKNLRKKVEDETKMKIAAEITNLQGIVKINDEKLKSKDQIINNLQAQINTDRVKMKSAMQINEDRKNALLHQKSQVQCLKQQLEKDAQAHSALEEELKKEINEMKDSYVLLQEQMRDRELEDANVITDLKAKLEVKRQEKIDFVMKQMKSESKSRRVLSLINHQLNDFNGKFDSQTAELKEISCKFDKQTAEIHELCKQIEELKIENQTLVGLYHSEKKLRQTLKSG